MPFHTFHLRFAHRALGAAVLSAALCTTASGRSPTPIEPSDAPAGDSVSYLRVAEQPGETLALEIAERVFVPAREGDGPRVALVAVAHIGDSSFYESLQQSLNTFDVVLFESVTPAGTGDVSDENLNETQRVERTRAGLQFVASVLEKYHAEHTSYPGDLEQLRTFAVQRDARLRGVVRHALIDGWGNAIQYASNEKNTKFELVSYGADGEPDGDGFEADISISSDDASEALALDDEQTNLQGELANALGLAFQLHAIDYDQPNWRVADMSIGELQRALAERGVDFAPLEDALAGSSIPAKVARFILRMIPVLDSWTEGRVTDIFKIVLIEMLGNETIMEQSFNQFGEAFTDVIINQRNAVALDQLRRIIAEKKNVESVAIFYGAGHMADFHQRLIDEFNYTALPEATTWRSAIGVNLRTSNLPPAQIEHMRRAMRRMLEQSMKQMHNSRQ